MAINPAPLPLVNGVLYSHASAEIALDGTERYCTAIDYDGGVTIDDKYANSILSVGVVITKYAANGSMEMLLADAQAFITALGAGYLGARAFDITVTYSADGESTITDKLEGVRIKKVGAPFNDGEVKRKFDLYIKKAKLGGVDPVV